MKLLLFTFSLTVISILLFETNLSGNEINDSEGKKTRPIDFTQEDAYYIYNNLEIEVFSDYSLGKPKAGMYYYDAKNIRVTYSSRIKLNTRNGVEKYSYLTLNSTEKKDLKSVEIRSYKPNGSVIEFDSTQILRSLVPLSPNQANNLNLTKYVIPGVEAGDEIEINYICEFNGGHVFTEHLNGNIFPQKDMPSLQSNFRIIVPAPYRVFYKCYNKYREPYVKIDNIKAICTFHSDSTIAVKDVSYACMANELPYFYYSIEYRKELSDNTKLIDLYNEFIKRANLPINPYTLNDVTKKWIRENLKDNKKNNRFQQFEILYKSIMDNFVIDEGAGSDDFFTHKIRRFDLYRLYVQIFNYLNIDYFLCLAKSKYEGDIDLNFIRRNEFTDQLFMYYDNDSNKVFIYPHTINKKYNLNEFPSFLNGTNAVLIRQATKTDKNNKTVNSTDMKKYPSPFNRKFADLIEQAAKTGKNNKNANSTVFDDFNLDIRKIPLLMSDEKSNYYFRQRIIGIDLKSEESSYNSTINLTGLSATDGRILYDNIFRNKENYKLYLTEFQKGRDIFKVDSIYLKNESNTIPFKYSIAMTGKLGRFYNYINDTTIVISINEILNNNKIEYNKRSRNLDILLPYAFSDILDLIIEFKQPIKVINQEILKKEMENSLGSYKFEMVPLEGNKLHLTSTYIIKDELIKKFSFNKLDEINDASGEMSNSRIIVRIKK